MVVAQTAADAGSSEAKRVANPSTAASLPTEAGNSAKYSLAARGSMSAQRPVTLASALLAFGSSVFSEAQAMAPSKSSRA